MITETRFDDPAHYEQRYTVHLGSVRFGSFVRRPVAMLPPDPTVCFIDNGGRYGTIPRRSAAVFTGGKWKGAKFEPTHWTENEDLAGDE